MHSMAGMENTFLQWLQQCANRSPEVRTGIGDDMAVLQLGEQTMLLAADMLLDGVHFDSAQHTAAAIGRKALACNLSDCAAMAARPVAATVSLALPRGVDADWPRRVLTGMRALADEFEMTIAGGDTTSWDNPAVIDVAILATAWPGIAPVLRSGAKVGDRLCVTGKLGGSLAGRHLTFEPRVRAARLLVESLREHLHAMMDISDGLSLDLARMMAASGTGASLQQSLVEHVVHDDVRAIVDSTAGRDKQTVVEHALHDGEDFELLLAVDPRADIGGIGGVTIHAVGEVTEVAGGLVWQAVGGTTEPLTIEGYEH